MADPSLQASPSVPMSSVPLPSGALVPLLGFGTWQITRAAATETTRTALQVGYRHLDTATVYGNEREVGQGVRDSGVPREEVFVTTKCPPNRTSKELETLESSLELLGLDYVDLWLVHWTPNVGPGVDIWEAFVEAQRQGLARDIGVSNYSIAQTDELAAATGVRPAVNQIEWSPLLYDAQQLAEHRHRGIALEGYSGLRGGILDNTSVLDIARTLGRTPAQVIVRWHLQHDVIVIPKSSHADRIRTNAEVADFVLSQQQMRALDALSGGGA